MIERFNINKIPSSDWYVDGVFGIGLNRDLQGNYQSHKLSSMFTIKKILSLDFVRLGSGIIFNSAIKAATIAFLH